MKDNVLLRCNNCKTINRVTINKIQNQPICGKCKAILTFSNSPQERTISNFNEQVLEWPGAVLVEFWASWCGHCQRLAPVLQQIAQEKAGLIKIMQINSEQQQPLAINYKIQGVPTMILFDHGRLINQIAGALSKDQILGWMQYYIQL